MSISILGYDPQKSESNMPYNAANKGQLETMDDREKWEVYNMTSGKMSVDEIDHQIMYHQMVHQLLYNPMCKIGEISMGEEDGYDTVIVKFKKIKENKNGMYDYNTMNKLKTEILSSSDNLMDKLKERRPSYGSY